MKDKMIPKINLAVIGAVDHGKSTLIGRLLYDTGSLPEDKVEEIKRISKNFKKDKNANKDLEFAFFLDSFREERVNALTLDTTQVRLKVNKFEYNIIDCPGHKEFIRNMLTGTSQAQVAILVVSARLNEGFRKQAKLHILLAKMLGIKQLFIAVNKMDLVNYNKERFREIKTEALKFLRATDCYQHTPFIPISAMRADNLFSRSINMNWYKGKSLVELLNKKANKPIPSKSRGLRVLIQDIYDNKGRKIFVGRVESGVVRRSSKLFLNISRQLGKVVSLVNAEGDKEKAEAGECISFQLLTADCDKIKRGEVGSSLYYAPSVKKSFFARIFVLGKNLNKNDKLIIRCGTAERNCRIGEIIQKLDYDNLRVKKKKLICLKEDDIAEVKITADEPLAVERFSRFPSLGRFLLIKKNKILAFGIIK